VSRCEACELARTRTQTVFMDGVRTGPCKSGLLFVGEAPGADEDAQGVPFVGRAGQLLTEIITKGIGIPREEVQIANVLKCRPPGNRDPTSVEKEACTPWLERQLELTSPRAIVPLGKHAANYLLGLPPETPMGQTRGRTHVRKGRTLIPTYHPAYLLRTPGEKKACWQDIQVAMNVLGIARPPPRDPSQGPSSGIQRAPTTDP
jgi:uracil-DNA glycosylase family 4